MDRYDARVIELAGHLRLLEEPSERALVDERRAALDRRIRLPEDHLHRQRAPQVLVPDPQDRSHPSARDLALDRVARLLRRVRGEALDELTRRRDGLERGVLFLGGVPWDARVDVRTHGQSFAVRSASGSSEYSEVRNLAHVAVQESE